MAETHINTFVKGVDRDTSLHAVPSDRATALHNMRLVTSAGQGFVLTNLEGNEEKFSLSDGFVPLGYATYGGVAFIFSLKTTTFECEVGTYPSPIDCNGGYEHQYKPLNNWNQGVDPRIGPIVRSNFRTDLFNFDCSRQLEVQARISYDGSVELFFADWRNPLRHLNTGFEIETGKCIDTRIYWTGSFPNQVNVFFETCGHPIETDVRQTAGGALQAGNYFVYLSYSTIDLNPTSYLAEIGPIQISQDDISAAATLDGNPALTDCGKAIEIDLTNIDSTFPYINVAVVYYHNDTYLVGQVVTPYATVAGQTTLTIRITGIEPLADITLQEIITRKTQIDTPRTITQLDNRLWGGNWKERSLPYADMRALAQSIPVKPPLSAQLPSVFQPRLFGSGQTQSAFGHKDPDTTLDLVGYFRGEPYAFAIVFVFVDGKESIPYPVKGYDAWFDPGASQPNTKGILRFPSNTRPGYEYVVGDNAKPMGVRFDTTGIALPVWAIEQVCGFYFMRAERNPDLIYQGIVSNSFNTNNITPADLNFQDFTIGDKIADTKTCIAEFSRRSVQIGWLQMPYEWHDGGGNFSLGTASLQPVPGRHGMFSTDHFFKRSITDGIRNVVRLGLVSLSETRMGGNASGYDPDILWDQTGFVRDTGLLKGKVQVNNVAERNTNVVNDFTSAFVFGDDSNAGGPMFMYYADDSTHEFGNRQMAQRNYIGLSYKDVDGVDVPGTDNLTIGDSFLIGPSLVNIYFTDPEPTIFAFTGPYVLTDKYEPAVSTYRRISPFVPIGDWANLPNVIFYRGDCFLTRAYHRHLNEWGFHTNDDSAQGLYYAYGNMLGSIQECAVNSAMRFEAKPIIPSSQRYFPEKGLTNPITFAAQDTAWDESRELNNGYNKTLGLQGNLGDDTFVPYQGRKHPTRIRYSNVYENENVTDAYLNWDFDARRDYDHRSGQIVHISAVNSRLISIQEQAVNLHYTNDRAQLQTGAGEGELLLGIGDVLSEKAQVLTDEYGSQHQFSMVRSDLGLYGWDRNKRKVWRLTAKGLDLLSDRLMFRKDVTALAEPLSSESDIIHAFSDNAVCNQGIVGFWDRRHGDVGWSIIAYDFPEDNQDPLIPRYSTVVYNEWQDAYMHERSHNSPFYLRINEDLYSVDPLGLPMMNDTPLSRFYLHDSNAVPRCNFYGVQANALAAWSINPAMMMAKVYDALHLASGDQPLTRFSFATEFQTYTLDPFLSINIWETPVFRENTWKMPVLFATAVNTDAGGQQEYAVGSKMRGRYGQAIAEWNTEEAVHLDAAITTFRRSLN